jgi:hypothetical protein
LDVVAAGYKHDQMQQARVGAKTGDQQQQQQQLNGVRKGQHSRWAPSPLPEAERSAAIAVASARAALRAPGLLDNAQEAHSQAVWRTHLVSSQHHLRALLLSAKHNARAAAMHFNPGININAHASLVHCWYPGCDLGANSVGALLAHVAHMHNKEVALMDWEGVEVRFAAHAASACAAGSAVQGCQPRLGQAHKHDDELHLQMMKLLVLFLHMCRRIMATRRTRPSLAPSLPAFTHASEPHACQHMSQLSTQASLSWWLAP